MAGAFHVHPYASYRNVNRFWLSTGRIKIVFTVRLLQGNLFERTLLVAQVKGNHSHPV
jgi:hypothetical protein